MPPERPDIFVASEFFAQEPLRVAKAAMLRERRAYIALFSKALEERSPEELGAAAELIQRAAWFSGCFSGHRSRMTSAGEQAADLARVAVVATYEPGGDGEQLLCTKGEEVNAFFVIIAGAVKVSGDPLTAPHERADGQWFGTEALVPPKKGMPPKTAAGDVSLVAGSGKLTLLKISRGDHLAAMGLQRQRQYRAYADVLSRLPMLSHYTCAQRTELASSFTHVAFKTDETVVQNAARDKNIYVLLHGSVKVRKRMHVSPVEDYDLELRVLQEGDLFGGDRFGSGLQIFENLSFIAVQAIECLKLSTDHRLLDTRARTLIIENFTWIPEHDMLLRAFGDQEQWEQIKSKAIKQQFKASLSHQANKVPEFAHSISQQTFTRTSRYVPSGNFVGFGRDGRHRAETPSQFERRKSAVEKETRRWESRLSRSAGGRRRIGGARPVSSVPLAMTRYEAMALAEAKQQISANGGTVSDADLSSMISFTCGRPSRGTKPGRPPKPVTPDDFGAPWTVAASATQLAPLSKAPVPGSMFDADQWSSIDGAGIKSRLGTPDSMAVSDDGLLMEYQSKVLAGDTNAAMSVSEMWPDGTDSMVRESHGRNPFAGTGGGRRRRSVGVETWGVQALATAGATRRVHSVPTGGEGGAKAPGASSIRPKSSSAGAAAETGDDTAPRMREGFDRMILQRLCETQIQHALKTKQARSTQYYPTMPVLVADVVDASGLRDCGPELSFILDDIFTKFKELAERYGAHALWGRGNRFVALGGVQENSDSSCIGNANEAVDTESIHSTHGGDGVKWSERSFEATTSFLEGVHERAENSRARTIDSAFDDSTEAPKPKNLALDLLVQLAHGLQRCVKHANDETVGHRRKWPGVGQLKVKIGIAVGPAVVGFFGFDNPFLYSVDGWTIDEALRLESSAKPGAILLDVTAHQLVGNVYDCEPLAALSAKRSGPSEGPEWDYELKMDVGVESTKGKARYRHSGSTGASDANAASAQQQAQAQRQRRGQLQRESEATEPAKESKATRKSTSLSHRPGLRLRPSNYSYAMPLREQLRGGKLKPAHHSSWHKSQRRRPLPLAGKCSQYWGAARNGQSNLPNQVGGDTVDLVTERVSASVSAYM